MERIGGVAAALAEISRALEVLESGGGQSGVGARLGGSVEKLAGNSYWWASVKLKRNVLDELVTAQLLKLDEISSEGDAAIRAARKVQVHAALALGERVKALLPPEMPLRAETGAAATGAEESATVSALRIELAAERAKTAQQAERLAHLEGSRSNASVPASQPAAAAEAVPASAAAAAEAAAAPPPAEAAVADAAADALLEAPAEPAAPSAATDPLRVASEASAASSASDPAAAAAALAEADAERW